MLLLLGTLVTLAASQTASVDSLRQRAAVLPDSALVEQIRHEPLAARDVVNGLLADREINVAQRVAAAYATAWRDSILLRQVARFAAATPRWRSSKVAADSLRRVGVGTYGRRGPVAAITVWRVALARASAIDDSIGAAATEGNIGAAFARMGRLDSATLHLERARRIAKTTGDLRVEANAASELAGVSETRDSVSNARATYAVVVELHRRIGDTRGLASDYNNLGLLAQRMGDADEARRDFQSALALNRRDQRDGAAATNLVNLAGLASTTGEFARASSLYREALALWRAAGESSESAEALYGLGQLELRRGDYPTARTELSKALIVYERSGLVDEAIRVRQDLAAALRGAGELQLSLEVLRRAQAMADSAKRAPSVRAGVALARADLAAQLNAREEADRNYKNAYALFRRAGDRLGQAEAAQGLSMLALDADDAERARPLLTEALRGEIATGNQRAASVSRIVLAQLLLQQRDTGGSRQSFTRAATELDRLGDSVAAAAAIGELAALDASTGLRRAADSLYSVALAHVGQHYAPHVTWRLHAGLASLRQQDGALDDAARQLREAVADIERPASTLALAERRAGFLSDKSDVYVALALVERERGRVADAFAVSEQARAREMLELLAQGRITAPADTAAELVAREQDLRRRIAELTRDLESGGEGRATLRGPDVSSGRDVAREALVSAQSAYSELLLELRERAPHQAMLVSQPRTNWRDVSRRLRPDEAFIEYLVGDSTSIAFLVTRDTIAAVELGVDRHSLSKSISFVRGVLEPRGSSRFDELWRGPMRELDDELFVPLERSGLLAGKTRLTIVPQEDLHYLPFAALLDRATGRFLVERFEIAVTPSAAVWLTLEERRSPAGGGGLLALAPHPELLPASRAEVESLGRVMGAGSRVLVGRAATTEAFRREAPHSRVVHLATYGILNKVNPLLSFVELAPNGSDDGRLEVHDVFGLRLTADLVVLSACQTALGSGMDSDVPPGDDWVGLTRAFLHAGASRVVASLWPVQDRATSELMERFYRGYAMSQSPASALASAQRMMLATPGMRHPFYWAAFEVVGTQ